MPETRVPVTIAWHIMPDYRAYMCRCYEDARAAGFDLVAGDYDGDFTLDPAQEASFFAWCADYMIGLPGDESGLLALSIWVGRSQAPYPIN